MIRAPHSGQNIFDIVRRVGVMVGEIEGSGQRRAEISEHRMETCGVGKSTDRDNSLPAEHKRIFLPSRIIGANQRARSNRRVNYRQVFGQCELSGGQGWRWTAAGI